MEISTPLKLVYVAPVDAAATARSGGAKQAVQTKLASTAAEELPLEQLQQALRAMPDVDLDRVATVKQALARGEIDTDPAALARGMLAYHRGSDV